MSTSRGLLLFRQLSGGDKEIAGMFTGEDVIEKCQAYIDTFETILKTVSDNKVGVSWWAIGFPENPAPQEVSTALVQWVMTRINHHSTRFEPFSIPGF